MYRQLLEFVLCVCFLVCLLGMIDCQAPVGGAGDAGAARVDPPGREPQVLIKMQEMEVAGGKEGRRKLEGDQLEALNHKKDEELREKGDVKNVEMQVQVGHGII